MSPGDVPGLFYLQIHICHLKKKRLLHYKYNSSP